MKKSLVLLIAPVALLVAACGSSSSTSTSSSAAAGTPSTSTASAELSTRTLAGVGAVLVNAQGHTLYVFAPDNAKKVTCTGSCAAIWPPLTATAGQKASVSGGVNAAMVSSDPNPSGGDVVTYNGWPLYLYTVDTSAGTDTGQAINSSGGLWYVIAASGKVIKAKSSSSSSSSSPSAY